MPTPTATPQDGKARWGAGPEELAQTTTGWAGKRFYTISTRDIDEAVLALGLPKIGHAWSPAFPNLQVVNRKFTQIGGVFNTATQAGGFTSCEVIYATPSGSGRAVPSTNLKFSEWDTASEAITRNFDVRFNPPPGTQFVEPPGPAPVPIIPINNGKGVQVGVGTARIIVTRWMKGQDVPLPKMLKLRRDQLVNVDDVTVPPILGDTRPWTFEPGQLQYVDFRLQPEAGLVRVSHIMNAAPDFFFTWQPEDENGNAVGERVVNVLYAADDFQGLW